MAISDDFLFTLQEVCDELNVDDNCGADATTLYACFSKAACVNSNGWNTLYYSSAIPNSMREFRDYDRNAVAIIYSMSISTNFDYTAIPSDGILTDPRVYMNVGPDPNNIVASFSTNVSWITLTNATNKTDGTYMTPVFDAQPTSSSPARSGRITLTYQSGGTVSSTSVSIFVTQDAGPDAGGPIQ